ncbi:hypothetical protein VULLAG_LOCUS23778 [Vulpes lagopus]
MRFLGQHISVLPAIAALCCKRIHGRSSSTSKRSRKERHSSHRMGVTLDELWRNPRRKIKTLKLRKAWPKDESCSVETF